MNQGVAGGRLLWNSTAALVLAAVVDVTLHELAHAVVGLAIGVHPTLYRSAVSFDPTPPPSGQIVTAAAGPLFSLVFGIAVFLTCRNAGRGVGRLFGLWLALIATQNFFGYAIIAPLARGGDSGKVLDLLGAPRFVYPLVFVAGVVGMWLNARLLAGQVLRYATSRYELLRMVLFPWLVGTAIVVVLDLVCLLRSGSSDQAVLIVAGSVAIAIFAPFYSLFLVRALPEPELLALGRPLVPWALVAVAVVVVVVVIAPGVPIGPA